MSYFELHEPAPLAADRHRHHPDEHVRVVGSLLVGLAALLALLPFLLALACLCILFFELALPHVNAILHHALVRCLLTSYDAHQPEVMDVAVAVLHAHPVGIGSSDGHQAAQHGQVHRHGNAFQRLLQTDGKIPHIDLHACLLGHSLRIGHLLRRNAQFERLHNRLHHLRHALGLLLAGRVNHAPELHLRQSEAGHHLHQQRLAVVADGTQVHRQLVELHVALALGRLTTVPAPPLLNDRCVGNALETQLGIELSGRRLRFQLTFNGLSFQLVSNGLSLELVGNPSRFGFVGHLEQRLVHILRVVSRHHVDAAAHILHGLVRLEARHLLHQRLSLVGGHARRQFHEHVRTSSYALLDEQHLQGRCLQQTRLDLLRVTLLVEVQHQAVQRLHGIRNRPVVVLELGAMRSPHGQAMLQLLVALLDALAHLLEPRLPAHLLPILLRGWGAWGAMIRAHASEILVCISFFVHMDLMF